MTTEELPEPLGDYVRGVVNLLRFVRPAMPDDEGRALVDEAVERLPREISKALAARTDGAASDGPTMSIAEAEEAMDEAAGRAVSLGEDGLKVRGSYDDGYAAGLRASRDMAGEGELERLRSQLRAEQRIVEHLRDMLLNDGALSGDDIDAEIFHQREIHRMINAREQLIGLLSSSPEATDE